MVAIMFDTTCTTPVAANDDLFGQIRKQATTPATAISVLEAVTATINEQKHEPSPTAYFAALITMMERSDIDVNLAEGITYLLSTLMQSDRLSASVIVAKFDDVTSILLRAVQAHAESAICTRHVLLCLSRTMSYVDRNVWANPNTVRVLQAMLVFAVDPRPKVRRTGQAGVVGILKTLAPNVPTIVAECVRLSCRRELDNADVTVALHLIGLLQSTVSLLPLTTIAALVEMFHAQATSSRNNMLKLRLIQCLTTLFESAGLDPTPSFVETMLSALQSISIHDNDYDAGVAMLKAITSGYCLLHRISSSAVTRALPRYFNTLPDNLLHSNASIGSQSQISMTTLLSTCIDRTSNPELITSLCTSTESLLTYRFKARWTVVLPIVSTAVAAVSKCADAMSFLTPLISSLDAILSSVDVTITYKQRESVRAVMSSCVEHLGAAAVLDLLPIEWPVAGDSGSLQEFLKSSRIWLLPMIKTSISSTTSLSCFKNAMLPAAISLYQWAQTTALPVERQALNALVLQIWESFPAFCAAPIDRDAILGELAPALCEQLEQCPDARVPIGRGLNAVLAAPMELSLCEPVAKALLPALFTTITLLAPDKRQPLLECTKSWCGLASSNLVNRMFKTVMKRLLSAEDAETNHNMMDLCNAMCTRLDDDNRGRLLSIIYQINKSDDVFAQKRAYQCWRQLLDARIIDDWSDAFSQFTAALSSLASGARKARLLCIPALCALIPDDQIPIAIPEVLGECILSVKEANVKVRDAAYNTIIALGERVDISEYVMMLLGGLAGTPQMQSASVLAMARFLFEKRSTVSKDIIAQILETVLLLFQSKAQEVMKSVLSFIKVAVASLTPDLLRPHLKAVLAGLDLWANQNKNRFRQKWRFIIERMLRRFSYEELHEVIPLSFQPFLNSIQKAKKKSKEKKTKAECSYENILNDEDEEEVEEDAPEHDMQDGNFKQIKLVNTASEPLDLLNLSQCNVLTGSFKKKRKSSDMQAAQEHLGKLIIEDDDEEDNVKVQVKAKKLRTDRPDKRRKGTMTKKQVGDARKKGDQYEPFAYQPLDPHALSRRHQAKAKGTFKALVGKKRK